MNEKEILDYCRIKKIFDKGFGFLTSLYHQEDVFLHFSRIKDEDAKEKLQKMKRGMVYLFYTSRLNKEGKRKVDKLWLDLEKIDKVLIHDFLDKITAEFNDGYINIYELAHVVKMFREKDILKKDQFSKILNSHKVCNNPSAIKSMFTDKEAKKPELNLIVEKMDEKEVTHEEGINEILKAVN
ncbi:MAG: cold shock domain-containing protein [Melioribacteraceae bacterium]|nr:cold shock domain-containing protein [Melioribacteraceae bacterium]